MLRMLQLNKIEMKGQEDGKNVSKKLNEIETKVQEMKYMLNTFQYKLLLMYMELQSLEAQYCNWMGFT